MCVRLPHHPWRKLRDEHPTWTVLFERLPHGFLGLTDYRTREITIDHQQLQRERRATLTHELIHIREGHDGHCNEAVERRIEREVARTLIPIEQLVDAACWARSRSELAEELWVDDRILNVRLETLHPAERGLLVRSLAAREPTA